jgi:hypothetical protein
VLWAGLGVVVALVGVAWSVWALVWAGNQPNWENASGLNGFLSPRGALAVSLMLSAMCMLKAQTEDQHHS